MRYVNRNFWEWTFWALKRSLSIGWEEKEKKDQEDKKWEKTKSDQNCGEREWKILKKKKMKEKKGNRKQKKWRPAFCPSKGAH